MTTIAPRPRIVLLSLSLLASGCAEPLAHGDTNALIVAASPALWAEVQDVFTSALEPTFQSVRNERPFRVTYQDPGDRYWPTLQRFRQVLLLGSPSDPWVAYALAEGDPVGEDEGTAPDPASGIRQFRDVWARGQLVTAIVLPESGQPEAVAAVGEELHRLLNVQYRNWAQERMFVSGANTVLADSLLENVGFAFTFPMIYRYSVQDSVFRFRNDQPSPTELIREIGITWTPIRESDPTREEMEGWRQAFADAYYNDPQRLDTTVASYRAIEVNGLQGVEFQSAWASLPGEWPAGGPFLSRAIRCPAQNRTYWMDAWLYAPNRDKYEYVIQLETILNSFRCAA